MNFDQLGLSEKVVSAVAKAGYTTPTPIQAQAIPHILQRKDVLGIAQTGTGKTAAFVLPMLTLLEQGRPRARMPRTLILEPTRELAAQVEENFVKYGINHKLNVALLIGGVSFGDQDAKITRGVDVLIATPGRLLDHIERGKLLLTGVELLVIDEADRMLDMGFIPDIERIGKLVPFTRQTLFFTATMPSEIQRIADQFLHTPERVEVSRPATTATTVTQTLVAAGSEAHDKRDVLRDLIRNAENLKTAIVFCNRKREVAVLHTSLRKHGFNAVCLHGDMDQPARMAALDQFRKGDANILVASDVAARGLDIPDVSHVFNFDVPHHPDDYVHRIGRTGRAGRSGVAMTIVTPADAKAVSAIEKLTAQSLAWTGPETRESSPREDRPRREGRGRPVRVAGRESGRREGPRDTPSRDVTPRAAEEARETAPARRQERPAAAAASERGAAPRRGNAPARGSEQAARFGDRVSRAPRPEADEPADMSHMPAFLLRPVRVSGG